MKEDSWGIYLALKQPVSPRGGIVASAARAVETDATLSPAVVVAEAAVFEREIPVQQRGSLSAHAAFALDTPAMPRSKP
jgi:hypothetical protein